MEISRSETGFFHVAYAVKNSPGLSTGFDLLTRRDILATFPEFRFWQHQRTSRGASGFVAWSELQRLAGA